jgi:parallel beta-helix repeat protein
VIQSAINALTSGGKIFIKSGVYEIKSSLVPNNNELQIEGEGVNVAVLKLKFNGDLITYKTNQHGLYLKHLTLDGNKAEQTSGKCLSLSSQNFIWLENVEIKNSPSHGVSGYRAYSIYVIKSYIHDNGNHGVTLNQNANDIWIIYSILSSNSGHGAWITNNGGSGYEAKRIFLIGNRANNNGLAGLYVSDNGPGRAKDVTVANNICYQNINDGILLLRVLDAAVEGNVCFEQSTGDGITVDSSCHVTVSGNVVYRNYGRGILLTSATDPTLGNQRNIIVENIAYSNGYPNNPTGMAGIMLGETTKKTIVANNLCFDNGEGTQKYGIQEAGASDINEIVDNILIENVVGALVKVGANTKVRGNFGYVSENSGTATFSGNGSTTTFTIAHGLAGTPKSWRVEAGSSDAKGDKYVTADDTNLTVTFATAPPSGTNNVVLVWQAEM